MARGSATNRARLIGAHRYDLPFTIAAMDYGLCLPNFPAGATPEGIEAGVAVAEQLGWSTVWTTDHLMVPIDAADEYGHIYEAILTLAWVGARHPRVRLGTSVIVVPQRNAVVLAKELATLDVLSGGRVIAGVGVGWSRGEFANLGNADRFHVRGAYLDETIRLWRHLWSGSGEPFQGRFHAFEDFTFSPLPVQVGGLPIVVGGRSEPALRRAGALGDGYHSSASSPSQYGQRLPAVRAAAEAAGRPMPWLSARVRVEFEASTTDYAMRGTPDEIAAEVRAFAELGVTHLALSFGTTDPSQLVAQAERFGRDVAPLITGT
jgi:probable F420-dependent oxidoreductase